MVKSWAMFALATSAAFSTARAACVDIDQYLDIPSPMTADMEINLDEVDTIECLEIEAAGETESTLLETVTVQGGTLTLKSSNNVRFVNIAFTVTTGANLVFDMPKTKFGPNTEVRNHGESYGSSMVRVEEGAIATFLGQVVAKEVTNTRSLFRNSGSMEFKKRVLFEDGGMVLSENTGVVKFRRDATFKSNRYYALQNLESGYVRFSEDAEFDNNGFNLDEALGCSVVNSETSTIIFRGDTGFYENDCGDAPAVFNEGEMTFYGKAVFEDNEGSNDGAGLRNEAGSMTFKAAVQFNNNHARDNSEGGGLYVQGGDVVFNRAVTFTANRADSGAAFAIDGGSLTFKKPEAVISRQGIAETGSNLNDCTFGEVGEEGTLIGFTGDDVCVP